jgi:phosphoglycolate phosphatase-like HAD superfamily hydrolase
MIIDAIASLSEQPETCVVVGDSATDLRAARSAGVPFILVRTGRGEETLAQARSRSLRPDAVVDDLWDAFLTVRAWYTAEDRIAA